MTEFGPIYDPDEAEKLIDTYLEHGDLMGWDDKQSSGEQDEGNCGEEEKEDE